MEAEPTYLYWFLSLGIFGCVLSFVGGAIQVRGLAPATTARILLAIGWAFATAGAGSYLTITAPWQDRVKVMLLVGIPLAIVFVGFEMWMIRAVRKKEAREAAEREANKPSPEPPPQFHIVALDVTAGEKGYMALETNVFNVTQRRKHVIFPFVIAFESRHLVEGDQDISQVWAEIIFRAKGRDMELGRVNTGCWIGDPQGDVDLPLNSPKSLLVGGWNMIKGEHAENTFRLYEFDRQLNRPVEKKPGFTCPQELWIDITLTPNGHHEVSSFFRFDATFFDISNPPQGAAIYYSRREVQGLFPFEEGAAVVRNSKVVSYLPERNME